MTDWSIYAQWEHAHAEYLSIPFPIHTPCIRSISIAMERMESLLAQLRATPEHKLAFGW